MRQPQLMNEWGREFFGEAKTITGDIWWYEKQQSDGTIKLFPLMPMIILTADKSKYKILDVENPRSRQKQE